MAFAVPKASSISAAFPATSVRLFEQVRLPSYRHRRSDQEGVGAIVSQGPESGAVRGERGTAGVTGFIVEMRSTLINHPLAPMAARAVQGNLPASAGAASHHHIAREADAESSGAHGETRAIQFGAAQSFGVHLREKLREGASILRFLIRAVRPENASMLLKALRQVVRQSRAASGG